MGLDIIAYSKLHYVGDHEIDPARNQGEPGPWCYYEGHVKAYVYEAFPASFRGVPVVGQSDGCLHGGCFATTADTKTHAFRAGSYGGYGTWRRNLAEQFNPADMRSGTSEPDPDKPFYELIWFADNEGTISTEAAADLLADFRENEARYVAPTPWFAEAYRDWMRAFKLAADGGLVRFH